MRKQIIFLPNNKRSLNKTKHKKQTKKNFIGKKIKHFLVCFNSNCSTFNILILNASIRKHYSIVLFLLLQLQCSKVHFMNKKKLKFNPYFCYCNSRKHKK